MSTHCATEGTAFSAVQEDGNPRSDTVHSHEPRHWQTKWRNTQVRAQDKTERQNINVIQLAILILCLFVVRLGHTLEIQRRGQEDKQALRAGPKSPAASFHCVREAARQSSWEVPRLVTGQCNLETGKTLDRFHYLRSHIERSECCCRPQTAQRTRTASSSWKSTAPRKVYMGAIYLGSCFQWSLDLTIFSLLFWESSM